MKNIDWKILKVLYEKRSITKAAESLFMTQSALTKRLQSIENEWGRRIVEWTSKV
ncbi:MAG: LysR family transcriptional regulator [Clostridium sp.]